MPECFTTARDNIYAQYAHTYITPVFQNGVGSAPETLHRQNHYYSQFRSLF